VEVAAVLRSLSAGRQTAAAMHCGLWPLYVGYVPVTFTWAAF